MSAALKTIAIESHLESARASYQHLFRLIPQLQAIFQAVDSASVLHKIALVRQSIQVICGPKPSRRHDGELRQLEQFWLTDQVLAHGSPSTSKSRAPNAIGPTRAGSGR